MSYLGFILLRTIISIKKIPPKSLLYKPQWLDLFIMLSQNQTSQL